MNWPLNWTSFEELKDDEFKYWKEASAAGLPDSSGRCVRPLWWIEDPSEAPHRPQPSEQQPEQYRSALREVSRSGAPDVEAGQLRNLRDGVSAEAGASGNAMRERGLLERKRPPVSRVAVGVVARVDRLKAIGNGQVPQCAAEAFKRLTRRTP